MESLSGWVFGQRLDDLTDEELQAEILYAEANLLLSFLTFLQVYIPFHYVPVPYHYASFYCLLFLFRMRAWWVLSRVDFESETASLYSSKSRVLCIIRDYGGTSLLMDTTGTTRTVPITEVSLFQGLICTLFYIAGTRTSVLIYREVSLFWRPLIMLW